jgi:hypothetical protein
MSISDMHIAPAIRCHEGLVNIYERLSRAVLMPHERDRKPTRVLTFDATQEAVHVRLLMTHDVSVCCGIVSENLCAIVLETLASLEAFLHLNPGLRNTSWLAAGERFVLFVRIEGFCPQSRLFSDCTWAGDKYFIQVYAKDPLGIKYTWLNDLAPIHLNFVDIHWPPQIARRFYPERAEFHYGKPFIEEKIGKLKINGAYWAGLFSLCELVRFNYPDKAFYRFLPEARAWNQVTREELAGALYAFMRQESLTVEILNGMLDPRAIEELLDSLQLVAVDRVCDPSKELHQFVSAHVERHTDGDISTEELYNCYREWCARGQRPALSKDQFLHVSRGVIANIFGIGRSHSVLRNGAARRGYHNLRLAVAVCPDQCISTGV